MQEKKLPISSDVEILADSGYQGLQKYHKNTKLPIKKTKCQVDEARMQWKQGFISKKNCCRKCNSHLKSIHNLKRNIQT